MQEIDIDQTYNSIMQGDNLSRSLSGSATPELNTAYGAALRIIYSQRAAAKGNNIHNNLATSLPRGLFEYFPTGSVDLQYQPTTALWYEVMKTGTWKQHSQGSFQKVVWRVVTYATPYTMPD